MSAEMCYPIFLLIAAIAKREWKAQVLVGSARKRDERLVGNARSSASPR